MPVSLHHAVYMTYNAQKNSLRPGMVRIGLSPGQPKVLRFLISPRQLYAEGDCGGSGH